ncbi:MAG: TIGR03364 family FAD-dependent oxidoreductase [Bacteroidetes bacterium]|nr:TIGR03364 family FAD-dependent oxidoreductase [Bacteroidota bacterium]MBU1484823.1 TIGR03364 family FAD-dependent oxidoreductase [Bacteroidota bacterium]MBU1760868.1 TIGR03364 family FAD-dependent oxidoreductase [Bacteroidota bacterium]MBU2269440.1 TIGR03364 family FAD-dependent oxidoreductase [Bacteroidota bacterium]MBU2375788.1 TIGR03364 family FAD-dependent oxidoreductase [Bacteroidota bacterium]
MKKRSAIVIGAGVVGLATARALAIRNYKVTIFERGGKATGASIRNFGMIWPIGQPKGKMLERALKSKAIWKTIANEANIWYKESGSLHLAYQEDELLVMQEFAATNEGIRNTTILTAEETLKKSKIINPENLLGSLFSADEMIVEARSAIHQVALYLEEKYEVSFYFNKAISKITYPKVYCGNEYFEADEIYVCSGSDFETLYPEVFAKQPITKCKLQMMRMKGFYPNADDSPSLCGGLSMIHYAAFQEAKSLMQLKNRYEKDYAAYIKWGIHVMLSQNQQGEFTIGDSHEYGFDLDPFDKKYINDLILKYFKSFGLLDSYEPIQTWNGVYPKLTNGETELVLEPEKGVTIINGVGGAGMTLSFGLAEEIINVKS